MKLFFVLISCFFVSFQLAVAQTPKPTIHSLIGIGSANDDRVHTFPSVASVTPDGGFIVSYGIWTSTNTYLDSLCNISTGNRTLFIKYNADASVMEWTRCVLNTVTDTAYMYIIQLMPNGDSILFGYRKNVGLYMTKYDGSGNLLWNRQHGIIGFKPHPTKDGGFIFFGHSLQADSNFTTHYGGWMTRDLTLYKVDSMGRKQWSRVYGGSDDDIPVSLVDAEGGGWYMVASSSSTDYDCVGSKGNNGKGDVYIARMDSIGNMLWHRSIGGSESDQATQAIPNGRNGLYIGGTTFSKDGDVKNHHGIGFKANMWLMEVDSSGKLLWENCYGGGGGEGAASICRATDGSIWLAGVSDTAGGQVDTNYGKRDAFIVQADSLGTLLSALVLGSKYISPFIHGQDHGRVIHTLPGGKVWVLGEYSNSSGAFSSLPFRGGSDDIFQAILGSSSTGIREVSSSASPLFNAYPNPANDRLHIEPLNHNEKYTVAVMDNTGKRLVEERGKGIVSIDVHSWSKGIYIVQYKNDKNEKAIQKIIIQ